jgi:hypothetical protein
VKRAASLSSKPCGGSRFKSSTFKLTLREVSEAPVVLIAQLLRTKTFQFKTHNRKSTKTMSLGIGSWESYNFVSLAVLIADCVLPRFL